MHTCKIFFKSVRPFWRYEPFQTSRQQNCALLPVWNSATFLIITSPNLNRFERGCFHSTPHWVLNVSCDYHYDSPFACCTHSAQMSRVQNGGVIVLPSPKTSFGLVGQNHGMRQIAEGLLYPKLVSNLRHVQPLACCWSLNFSNVQSMSF